MSTDKITTSAALYFEPGQIQSIPLRWFERARAFLVEYSLSPVIFSANGAGFLLDDGYALADRGCDIVGPEGYVYAARRDELIDALRRGVIDSLGLDAPHLATGDRENWRAMVSISTTCSDSYVGVDEKLFPDPSVLLRRAHRIGEGVLSICYGTAYKMPHSEHPGLYAIGYSHDSLSLSPAEMVRRRRDGELRKDSDEIWRDELNGKRRHLTGLFRGAYPASILSEAHVQNANLLSHPIGRLCPLEAGLWLWELSESEIPEAQAMLASRRLLVSQTDEG